MRHRSTAGILCLALVGFFLAPHIATANAMPNGAVARVLAGAKAALGGDALDGVRSIHWTQRLVVGGISGTGQQYDDLQNGNSLQRQSLGPISNAGGFDGKTLWAQDATGDSWPVGDYTSLHAAATQAYLTSYSFLYPNRWPGSLSYIGLSTDANGSYYVIHAEPKNGFPVDISFNRKTYLIANEVVHIPNGRNSTATFSDYRAVGGTALPFAITLASQGNEIHTTVTRVELNENVAGGFTIPVTTITDASIAGGNATTLPFRLINNHIYVHVKINGQGPFLVVFDTGGQCVITPQVAARVGRVGAGSLQGMGAGANRVTAGFTWVDTLQLGGATLKHQSCAVLAIDHVMQAIEGVKIQGIVGFEVLRRFITTVDYQSSRLTLARAMSPGNLGSALSFVYDQTIPQVQGSFASLAGSSGELAGSFIIDTGDRNSLVVYTPFVVAHNLPLASVRGITGYGLGGPSYGALIRLPLFNIGPVPVKSVVATLSQDTAGATTEPGTAGNIGSGMLKRFTVTFAYRPQIMYLKPNESYDRPDTYDRSGLVLVQTKAGIRVIDALPGTPAARVGIKAGDLIVEVNKAPAASVGLLLLRTILHDAPGTHVQLTLERAGVQRAVTLVLANYV